MFKRSKIVLPAAAAGLFAAAALVGAAAPASADPWDHDGWRGRGYDHDNRGYDRDGRGYDREYRGYDRDDRARGYRFGYGYGWGRTVQRCYGPRCATFRCDHDGDRCTKVSGWYWR
jgi:hypothetical protein